MQIIRASFYRKFWNSLSSFLSVPRSSFTLCFLCDSGFLFASILALVQFSSESHQKSIRAQQSTPYTRTSKQKYHHMGLVTH